MIRHKWKDNKCVHCGVSRKRKAWKTLMAIMNHPPWEGYAKGVDWFYHHEDIPGKGKFQRPDCIDKKDNLVPARRGFQ